MPISLTIELDFLIAVVFIGVPGLIIWLLVRRAKRRGSIRVLSPDEVAHQREAEQRKAEEGWSLRPELNLPTPRPVRRTHLGIRLLRSLRMVLLLMIMMYLIYVPGFVFLHGGRPNSPPVVFHAFLNYLHAPYWQGWMLWPSVIFWGVAGLIVLVGYSRRRLQQKLLRWGKPACAVVTGCRGGDKGGTIWTLQYRDAAGNLVETDLTSVSRSNATGGVLTVLYDPDKPSRCITYPVWGYEIGIPENS